MQLVKRLLATLGLGCALNSVAQASQLAIVIDDIGYQPHIAQALIDLPFELTLAIIPFTPHSKELAIAAHRAGKEVMLHSPMSNNQQVPLGRYGLTDGLNEATFKDYIHKQLQAVPYAVGVNNHTGSQLTANQQAMNWLMESLAEQNLYFVDSRTTAATLAEQTAQHYGLATVRRHVFLDNQRSVKKIKEQLQQVINHAQQQGYALAIGHPYPETLAALSSLTALLEQTDVQLVSVSTLLKQHSLATVKKPVKTSHQTAHYCPLTPPLLQPRRDYFPIADIPLGF